MPTEAGSDTCTTTPPQYQKSLDVKAKPDNSLLHYLRRLVQVSQGVYYTVCVCVVLLTSICIQHTYNEYCNHAQFRDSIVCQDQNEYKKAGMYAGIYCQRHT